MNKQKQIKKLTWKFFWEQKREEIADFLIGLTIPYLFFGFAMSLFTLGMSEIMGYIPLYIFGGLWVIDVLVIASSFTISWILQNWKKAQKRAQKEYKLSSKTEKTTK